MAKKAPSLNVEIISSTYVYMKVKAAEGRPVEMQIQSEGASTPDIYEGIYTGQVGKTITAGFHKWRARVGYKQYSYSKTEWSEWSGYFGFWSINPPAPKAPNVSLDSNLHANMTFELPNGIDKIVIRRNKAGVSGSSDIYTGPVIQSYRDTPPGPGSFQYAVRAISGTKQSDFSPWSRSVVILPIPSAPSILSVQRLSGTQTKVNLSINSSSATQMYIYRQKSGETAETRVYASTPTTSFTDTPGAGTFRYRAKNHNVSGDSTYSAWSEWVSTVKPPNAPTIIAPASSAIVSSARPIVVQWRHNPTDGSTQAKAEIKLQGTKSPAKTYTVTGSSSRYTIENIPTNQEISFQVRTKGLHPNYSPWSATRKFKYLAPVTTSIRPIGIVKKFPIVVSWTYEDGYGTQAGATVKILLNGVEQARIEKTTEQNAVFNKGSFAIKDSSEYIVRVDVRSTSGMTAYNTAKFTTQLDVPGKPTADIIPDDSNASVSITPHATSGDIETATFTIFRNGKKIAENLLENTTIVDSTPPLGIPLNYQIVAVSSLGTSATTTSSTILNSNGFAFINFEDGFSDMAKFAMDLKLSEKVEVDKTIMVTPSRKYPVVIYGENETVRGSLSAKTWWLEDMSQDGQRAMCQQFEKLARYKGVCLLRMPHQETKFVIVNVSISKGEAYNLAGISIDYQEVDGNGLD